MPLKHSVTEVELSNGAKGVIVNVPDATVFDYEFNFRAGNSFVKSPEIQQAAHILEHLAFSGTEEYPSSEEFSQVFTENGAYINATTYEIGISYFGASADFEAERIIELQKKALVEPIFNQQSLDNEKKTVNEELTGQLSNYPRYLWTHISRAMGDDALTDDEKIKTIQTVSLEDIIEHRERTHTTENLRFILGGNLQSQRLEDFLKSIESISLPKGERLSIKKMSFTKPDGPVMIINEDVKNIYFGLTMALNRKASTSEFYVMQALIHILTGTFHSRIFGRARREGLCYYINSSFYRSSTGVSEFQLTSQITTENREPLYNLIIDELNIVKNEGVSEEELAGVKKYSFGEYQQYGQTIGTLTGYYASYFDNDEIIEIDKIANYIDAIKTEDIQKMAAEVINSGIWCFGELGNIDESSNRQAYDNFARKLFGEKGVQQ